MKQLTHNGFTYAALQFHPRDSELASQQIVNFVQELLDLAPTTVQLSNHIVAHPLGSERRTNPQMDHQVAPQQGGHPHPLIHHSHRLAQLGLVPVEAGSTGDCFFRSLCKLLARYLHQNSDQNALDCRRLIVKELRTHMNHYRLREVIPGNAEDFLKALLLPSTYIESQVEVTAAANALNLQIVIHLSTNNKPVIINPTRFPPNRATTIHLLNLQQEHYQPCLAANADTPETRQALARQIRQRRQYSIITPTDSPTITAPKSESNHLPPRDKAPSPLLTATPHADTLPPPQERSLQRDSLGANTSVIAALPCTMTSAAVQRHSWNPNGTPCPTDPRRHPNFCLFQPSVEHPTLQHRKPRQAHSTQAPPTNLDALRAKQFYTLQRYSNGKHRDHIVIGQATMPGSNLSAYARTCIEPHDIIATYDSPKPSPINMVLEHESPSNLDYAIHRTHSRTGNTIKINAYYASSCHARYIDEALTEDEENCCFELMGTRIIVRATRLILPGEELLTRNFTENISQRYKLPIPRQAMLTLCIEAHSAAQVITTGPEEPTRCYPTPSVQCSPVARPANLIAQDRGPETTNLNNRQSTKPMRPLSRYQQRLRRRRKDLHAQQVASGLIPPTRRTPAITPTHDPSITPEQTGWTRTYTSDQPICGSLCIMAWSCSGRLYSQHQHLDLSILLFLDTVVMHIEQFNVDVMWLSDAHFLEGEMNRYLPYIYSKLPDSKVYSFSTTRVATLARSDTHNRMGATLAIVTHRWKAFTTHTYTDPMGLGIVNALYFKIEGIKICSINTYCLPTTHSGGPATLYARVKRFLDHPGTPPRLRHLTPSQAVYTLVQKLITKAKLHRHTTIIHGDFNAPITPSTNYSQLTQWMQTNTLYCPSDQAFQSDPTYYTRRGNHKHKNTTIDHIMHTALPAYLWTQQIGTVNNYQVVAISQWIKLAIAIYVPRVPKRIHIPSTVRVDINARDTDAVARYNDTLLNFISAQPIAANASPEQSGHIIAALCRASVETVTDALPTRPSTTAKKSNQRRSKHKKGYSTEMHIRQTYLHFYTNLIRIAYPSGKRRRSTKWSPHTHRLMLLTWLTQWTTHHAVLHSTMPLPTDLPPPSHVLHLQFSMLDLNYLQSCRTNVKKSLHYSSRQQMRRSQNTLRSQIDNDFQNKRLGRVIQMLSAQPTSHCTLNTLYSPTEGQIVDHFQIHCRVTEFFHDWYQVPNDLDPAAAALTNSPDWWKTLLHAQTPHSDPLLHSNSSIPRHLQTGLRKVCGTKATPLITEAVRQAVDRLITFDEFSTAIDQLREGSAPGPSEATPNTLRAWNPAVRRFIYEHMQKIWQTRSCPQWFKNKLIKLAPKIIGSNDLNHMRPISLYEVIRKVWTTTVAKRIHAVWDQHQLLNPAQYGYRLNNGILMPLYNLLNSIEQAHFHNTPTLITFWDIRRAFDSIPRNLQRLAWTRLGVPLDLAEWFVSMDENGTAFVTTPYYAENKHLQNSAEILLTPTHSYVSAQPTTEPPAATGFQPQRGIGQGESASSLMWVAVYDILLDWIDPSNHELHPTGYHDLLRQTHLSQPLHATTNSTREPSIANAYADDLATISTGPHAYSTQQKQAEWISAFCAFTGLQLNMQKIVAVSIGTHTPTIPTFLTLYDRQWNPTKCYITNRPRDLTYLGLKLDYIITNETKITFQDLADKATQMLEHLLDQPGTVPAKLDYIRFKILPIILHTSQCANWSLPQYRAMDKPFTKAYKVILVLPQHFPTALLYLPVDKGGIGLPRLSDRTQVMKWRAFQRSLAVGHQPARSINAILGRLPIDTATTQPMQFIPHCQHWRPQTRLLARSLVDWLHESGITLTRTTGLTPEQELVRARNAVSLSQVARKIHLWFDPEIHDPDLPLLPLKYYVTDGSYNTSVSNYHDILTSEDDLRHLGTGAAAIVFQSTALDRAPIPHTVRITTRDPTPGMSAYAWEYIAQLVALKLTQYYPHTIQGYSDCKATIYRMNEALSSPLDRLGHTTAGILATSAHVHSSAPLSRQIQYIAAHPERDVNRWNNPTPLDKAIFLADAIAGQSTTKYNKHFINHDAHSLVLEDILVEILPINAWHMRQTTHMHMPVLDLPWKYQHQHQLTQYLKRRDQYATINSNRWQSAEVDFAAHVHPIPSRYVGSFWKAARRSCILFDWMGHGHNRSKQHHSKTRQETTTPTPTSLCLYCAQHDDQAHIMLICTNPLLDPIRIKARVHQSAIATKLLKESTSNTERHFIEQFTLSSWLSTSPTTARIWTGLWNRSTLIALLPPSHNMLSPMRKADRYKYRRIVTMLTQPLITAYKQMICIGTNTPPQHYQATHPRPSISNKTQHRTSLLVHQCSQTVRTNQLGHLYMSPNNSCTAYSYSDAAFSLTDAEVGTRANTT